jgi:hypothetical protein
MEERPKPLSAVLLASAEEEHRPMAEPKEWSEMTLREVFMRAVNAPHNLQYVGQTEFVRRQTEAAIETARFTRNSARYMLWSVVVLALSSLGTLVVTILAWKFPK